MVPADLHYRLKHLLAKNLVLVLLVARLVVSCLPMTVWLVLVVLATVPRRATWVAEFLRKVRAAHRVLRLMVLSERLSIRATRLASLSLSVRTVPRPVVVRAMGRQLEPMENVTPPLGRANYPRNLM